MIQVKGFTFNEKDQRKNDGILSHSKPCTVDVDEQTNRHCDTCTLKCSASALPCTRVNFSTMGLQSLQAEAFLSRDTCTNPEISQKCKGGRVFIHIGVASSTRSFKKGILLFEDSFFSYSFKYFLSCDSLFRIFNMFSQGHQEWRKHPWLRQSGNLRVMFPGLGTAIVIFGTYVFAESLYNNLYAKDRGHTSAHTEASQ